MSNSRRICVCGRERGKEPVVITITTCRHKHPPTSGEPLVVSSPPQTTSSLTRVKTMPDEVYQSTQPVDDGKSKNSSQQKEIYNESPQASLAADNTLNYETVSDSVAEDNTDYKTKESIQESETMEQTGSTVEGFKETDDFNGNQANGTLDDAVHDTSSDNENNDSIKNPTVMMVTETAVNTLPFLDNLFWPNTSVKSMPNLADDRGKKRNCAMELLIFKKHSNDCRNNRSHFKSSNSFFDGDSYLENFGRISLPICTNDVNVDASKSEQFNSHIKVSKTRIAYYESLLGTLETYLSNKRFLDDLSRNIDRKCLITDREDESSKYNVKEIYVRNVTTDRAIQFEDFYVSNVKPKKWYEWFLICFGLKNSDENYDGRNVNDEFIPKSESSYMVTKYLKI